MEKILSKHQINSALADNNVSGDKAVWIDRMLPTLAKQQLDAPIRYRTYGIYWWEIKRLLNQSNYYFGDNQEGRVDELYPQPYLYLAAGMLSAIARLTVGNFDNWYEYEKENGDQLDYVLEDRDMEMRMISKDIENFI